MIIPPRRLAPTEHVTARAYNALLDYARRTAPVAGANVSISYGMGGAAINGTPGGGAGDAGIRPFRVRYHEIGEGNGQWEIYLPPGCISVGDVCKVLNRRADTAAGHEDDGGDWYAFRLDESSAGDGTAEAERTFRVVVHGKPRAMRDGIDSLKSAAGPGVSVTAVPNAGTSGGDVQEVPSDGELGNWGDAFRQVVANVTVTGGGNGVSRSVRQICRDPISVGTREYRPFDLVWWFAAKDDGDLEVKNVYCVRQNASLAGTDMAIDRDAMTDVKDAERAVYLHVITQSGANVGEVLKDPTNTNASDEQTWVLLYLMKDNCVVSDSRTTNLSNIQYYR